MTIDRDLDVRPYVKWIHTNGIVELMAMKQKIDREGWGGGNSTSRIIKKKVWFNALYLLHK